MMILLYLSRIPGLRDILGMDSEPVISIEGSAYTYPELAAIKANKIKDALFNPCKGGTREGFSCELRLETAFSRKFASMEFSKKLLRVC